MKWIAALLSFLCLTAAGQQPTVLRGSVTSARTGEYLVGVFVQVDGLGSGTYTDHKGRYEFRWTAGAPDSISLSFYLTGYVARTGVAQRLTPGRITTRTIALDEAVFEQPEVVVRPDAPDTVWASTSHSVGDFAFSGEGLVLMVYEKEYRWKRQEESTRTLYEGVRLVYVDSTGRESQAEVPEIAEKLYVDYFDEVFVIGRDSVWLADVRDGGVGVVPFPRADFEAYIQPVVDTVGTRTVFTTYDPDYPAFEYRSFDLADSSIRTLRYLVDELTMELFRSEYKYLGPREKLEAFRFEQRTGIDKEIVAAYMRGFQQSYYYEPLNAPMIVTGDTLVLFDHHHDRLVRMDVQGAVIDSARIGYHESRASGKWTGKVMVDRDQRRFYTTTSRSGKLQLHRIDPVTGTTHFCQELTWRYVENVRIRNGWAYYIYRPFESTQKRYLYKERIRS